MSTWTQLTEELTVSERRKTSARLKAEEKALLEEERLKMVEKKRQELIEAHEKAKQEAIDEFEEQMSNLNDKMDQETTEARKACAQAEERTRVANELTMKADMKAKSSSSKSRSCTSSLKRLVAGMSKDSRRFVTRLTKLFTKVLKTQVVLCVAWQFMPMMFKRMPLQPLRLCSGRHY